MVAAQEPGTTGAAQAASQVKDVAAAEGGELKDVAAEHVSALADQAREHARSVVGDARAEIERQADEQGRRLGAALQDAGGQLRSMSDAGAEGPVTDLTRQLADALGRVSDTIDRGGVQAVAEDLRSLARRQPGLFLFGAGVAGFVATRLVRAAATPTPGGAPQRQVAGPTNGSAPSIAPTRVTPLDLPASPDAPVDLPS